VSADRRQQPVFVPPVGTPVARESILHRDIDSLSSEELILRSALRCFMEKGYHGTTIRSIAAQAGGSVPGLYHHFSSKSVLLERLIDQVMDDLIAETEHARDAAHPTPLDRFDAVVIAHVRFHCERSEESFIGNSELRSLNALARKRVIGKRDRQQRVFDRVVLNGVEAGIFQLEWPLESSRALVTMCTAVATWFRTDGPWPADRIVDLYKALARNLVCYSAPAPRSAARTGQGRARPPRARRGK
jgi:AcrR family transcriptional regulator